MQHKTTISQDTGLTPQQEQACYLLATGSTIKAVAEQINVNRSTIYQWQNSLAFQCFYNKQTQEAKEAARNAIIGLHQQAVNVVMDMLSNGNEQSRLKAAFWILEQVNKQEVGCTDLREAIKQTSNKEIDFDFGFGFNEEMYKQDCKRLGITP